MAFSALVVLVLVFIPDPLFGLLFGKEVSGIAALVLVMAPGIVAMALSQALSHYFSGTGRNVHNVAGSGLGLLITAVAGFVLVPEQGLKGAAITASLAYGANALYQLAVFLRTTRTPLRRMWYTAEDGERLRRLWQNVR